MKKDVRGSKGLHPIRGTKGGTMGKDDPLLRGEQSGLQKLNFIGRKRNGFPPPFKGRGGLVIWCETVNPILWINRRNQGPIEAQETLFDEKRYGSHTGHKKPDQGK